MAEKKSDKLKYSILRFLDVTGFTVFDPVVRLAFKEDSKKQIESIARYLVIPAVFIVLCIGLWWMIAPNHKTKSGEVPTPDIVLRSAQINDTFSKREKAKESDFLLEGEEREKALSEVKELMTEKLAELEVLKAELSQHEADYSMQLDESIVPLQENLDTLKVANRQARADRREAIEALAVQIESGEANSETLVAAMKADDVAYDEGRVQESVIKDEIEAIRSEKYEPMEKARLASNSVADEVQFLKKRESFLSSGNRSVKLAEVEGKLSSQREELGQADSTKALLKEAKTVIRLEESKERLSNQQYASAMTVYLQVKRSIFTVFVGFIIAAAIAIPVGVLCGLNRIAMACFTPIISIFKPVSPVVWLLIFQIVVGAFFPDPESHPFFLFFNSLPLIGSLGINPALIFSACTVAMCAVWPALVNTALGVASIDQDHINVARVLRLGFWERLFKIVIPSALPLVFAGLRISLGVGWMVLIAAEALSSSDGLGKFVWDEYQNGSSFSFANIIYACFVVGIIGFLLDRMMIILQRFVSFDGGGTSL